MFIAKKTLSRRTLLKGMGVAVGLPFLESMIPALAPAGEAAATPPVRFGVAYTPNGYIMPQFTPATTGEGFAFTPILKPLEPFKDYVVVVTNLTRSHPGSQVGDHAVSAAGFRAASPRWATARPPRIASANAPRAATPFLMRIKR